MSSRGVIIVRKLHLTDRSIGRASLLRSRSLIPPNLGYAHRSARVKNPRRARGYSRAALFTVIVATDKPVAFPRRLIISRRKRKGLSRNPYLYATIPRSRVYAAYVRGASPRTYFHGHQRRVIIGLHF